MAEIHPAYLPPLYQDAPDSGRLILRDGSTAIIRVAVPDDCPAVRRFFHRLSSESRRHRFFPVAESRDADVENLCDSSKPNQKLTLIVLRTTPETTRVLAVASYFAKDAHTAEAAFAVDDAFHGKGLGSSLFERLALLAVREGFTSFRALTHVDNRLMLEVSRRSGFALSERVSGDEVEIECSLFPTAASAARSEWLDRMFTSASLKAFFQPSSVAVIGASRTPSSIGYRILDAIVRNGFQGPVYPVNPRATAVRSIRAYPSVRDVPDSVELAIIVVPKDAVLDTVDACAAKEVRAVIVISAGFAEVGEKGMALQKRLRDKARGYGMRVVGPNCLGVITTDPNVRLNASFSPVYPPAGHVAMLSQSGALGIAVLALAEQRHLGLSHFVSVGNKADVSGNDLIQYWEQDKATNTILLYLESFGNPRRFCRIARRVSASKPIVAVKGGRSSAGIRAAGSHTAALAANDVAVEALFRQTGVIRAETLEEMFDLAETLSSQPLPSGGRVAIVTNAGGPGILCADACEAGGLEIPPLSKEAAARLAEFLPTEASLANPVDMIASASGEHYRRAIATTLSLPEIDALIILYIPVGVMQRETIVQGIINGITEGRQAGGVGKPIITCLMGEEGSLPPITIGEEIIPGYTFPEAASRVLGRMADYAKWRSAPQGVYVDFDDAREEEASRLCACTLDARGSGWLTAEQVRRVLSAVGLPVPSGGMARTPEDATALARQIGFPVAVKLASQQIVHKTEHGGVVLNIKDEQGVARAYETILQDLRDRAEARAMDGVIVQPMFSGGVELMVGMIEDPSFGPLIAFGLGGVHVEIIRDVSFRMAPLTDRDAREMIREIRGFRLLEGYRGHPPADIAALEELLLRLSRLVDAVPEIAELDLNPIFAMPPGQGCWIADSRIRVERPAAIKK